MNGIVNAAKAILNLSAWLDSIIFCRFNPNHHPPQKLALLPIITGIAVVILGVILSFGDPDNSIVADRLLTCALLWLIGLNVLLHLSRVFDMPTVKLKISYFLFISAVSYLTCVIAAHLTWILFVVFVLCIFLRVSAETIKPDKPAQGPAATTLSSGVTVHRIYGDRYQGSDGKQYTRDNTGNYKPDSPY